MYIYIYMYMYVCIYIYTENIFYLICSSSNTKLQQANLFSCIIAVHLSNKNQSSIKKEPGLEAALTEQRRIIESQSKVLSLAEDKFRRKPTAIFKIHFAGKSVIPVSCKGALIEDLNEHLSAGLPSVWDSMTVLTCTEFALLWKWYIPNASHVSEVQCGELCRIDQNCTMTQSYTM